MLVQVPPVPAAAAVSRYAEKTGILFVLDAHSGPFLDQGFAAGFYRRQLQQAGRRALVTLLHNTSLIPYAEALGMNWFILEDPVPECPVSEVPAARSNEVTVVCGYGRDEPVPVALQAARLLPESRFFFTGRMPAHYRLPPNAAATGYLSEQDYWQRLRSSGVIVALTTREATALGAAYDALAVERPMVLSRTQALEHLFPKGAVLVDNHPEAIAAGIQQARRHAEELIIRGRELRQEKARSWERQLAALMRLMTERHIFR